MNISEIKVGQTFNTFYGNGEPCGKVTITRINEKSIWTIGHYENAHEFRHSITTIIKGIQKGIYVPVS
jgi:hypothetical protein